MNSYMYIKPLHIPGKTRSFLCTTDGIYIITAAKATKSIDFKIYYLIFTGKTNKYIYFVHYISGDSYNYFQNSAYY
jgi:hypothetical protein